MIEDMKPTRDPSQFCNQKGVGIQHYLIQLIDRILTALDTNNQHEAYGIIVQLIDNSQAFDRQCPKMAVESFVNNNVRNSLIPVLVNYFQDRRMSIKWKNSFSSVRSLPGGGP